MEQAVLGALLADPDAVLRVPQLKSDQFFDRRHRLIFAVIQELRSQHHPVDVVTVFEALRAHGQDDQCGGLAHLQQLAQCVASSANIERHAQIVVQRAMQRAIAAAADQARSMALDLDVDPALVLDSIQKMFSEIARSDAAQAPERIGTLLANRAEHWEGLEAGTSLPGIPTQFERLNAALGGGLKGGKNIVLAGRPGSGKSSLAWSIACDVAGHGHPVLVLSMEMQAGDLVDRAVASLSGVSLSRLQTGKFEPGDWSRIADACEAGASMPLFISDQPALSLLEVRAKTRRAKQENGRLALVVVDYLQLAASSNPADRRHHQIEAISRGMKAMANELDITVLLLSQLTRESEREEPELFHLKESGAIEEDADTVILLHALGQAPEGGHAGAGQGREEPPRPAWTPGAGIRRRHAALAVVIGERGPGAFWYKLSRLTDALREQRRIDLMR